MPSDLTQLAQRDREILSVQQELAMLKQVMLERLGQKDVPLPDYASGVCLCLTRLAALVWPSTLPGWRTSVKQQLPRILG